MKILYAIKALTSHLGEAPKAEGAGTTRRCTKNQNPSATYSPSLPHDFNFILPNITVYGKQGYRLNLTLRDEQSVERVAMVGG